MRKLILILSIFICAKVNAQVYQEMAQYGYRANRMAFDSTLQIPTTCGVPTLKSNVLRKSAIAFDTCNNRFYIYNSKLATWSQVSGGGGATDTTSLSNRIDLRVPYTGANADVDLGTHKLSAHSINITGTNGNGHIDLRHQSTNATATGQSTALFADVNGDLKYKNDGNYYTTLKTSSNTADRVYTYPNATTTLIGASDTASMLSSYNTRINEKLNVSDTATMLTKYLRKTDTATLSNRINLKLNISDTATMLSSYSTRINGKLNISDTSTLQPKSIPSYTFLANNTTATANATTQVFKDTSGTYSGTITWTGTTAPSGATTHTYRWTRIGNFVNLSVSLVYATAGATLTGLTITLPSDAPTPVKPTGLTSASNGMYSANVQYMQSLTVGPVNASSRSIMRNNASNNGFEIVTTNGGATIQVALINIQYTAQ